MYCSYCGAALGDDARFCASCGRLAARNRGPERGYETAHGRVTDGLDLKRTMEEVSRYRNLARSGPITAQLVQDGVALHQVAMAELDAFIAAEPYRAGSAESLRSGVELNIYCDAVTFISVIKRLAIRDPGTKKLLQEVFPIYAQQGIVALVKVSRGRLGGRFSPEFAAKLEEYRAVRKYLDSLTFAPLLEGLQRNKLLPVKKIYSKTLCAASELMPHSAPWITLTASEADAHAHARIRPDTGSYSVPIHVTPSGRNGNRHLPAFRASKAQESARQPLCHSASETAVTYSPIALSRLVMKLSTLAVKYPPCATTGNPDLVAKKACKLTISPGASARKSLKKRLTCDRS
jgi:hypothetical protein